MKLFYLYPSFQSKAQHKAPAQRKGRDRKHHLSFLQPYICESGGVASYWEARKNVMVETDRSDGLIGYYLAYAGQADSAMVYIERAYREHAFPIHVLAVSQWARPLKDDPRYKDVVARLKLDHVKPAYGD